MIELRNIHKAYGRRVIVENLSLSIPTGTVFGFLGQNGAGKTTTMKMIVGLAFADRGTITIGGVSTNDISARNSIGFMPESPYFYDRLTGLEFLRFCGELFDKKTVTPDYEALLRTVDMYEARHRAIRTYSKGMKQRLGFAQAMVNNPDYLFLDEPLDGLDPIGRKEIKTIIKALKQEGKTIFFNSHILYDTEELCDQIGILDKGSLLYSGPVKPFCNGRPLEEQFVALIECTTL